MLNNNVGRFEPSFTNSNCLGAQNLAIALLPPFETMENSGANISKLTTKQIYNLFTRFSEKSKTDAIWTDIIPLWFAKNRAFIVKRKLLLLLPKTGVK